MARLRRDTQESLPPLHRSLRIIASGTLFLTHTLSLPTHPSPSTVIRAHSVTKTRGGAASTCLSILAQFPGVEAMLVAPLGNNDEAKMIISQLEREGVSTRYSKIWEGASVPSAWVLQSDETDTQTIINHNPLPDITHEDFVSLLGPILVPENYVHLYNSPNISPTITSTNPSILNVSGVNNAPFEWLHFEGRSVKTTLNNMIGVDGLAKERKWRHQCVFSLDVGRKARQGVQALMPHADIIFLNIHYAKSHCPSHTSTPRSFLLSLAASPSVASHALLIAYWGNKQGAAVLSVPTKEYFQSSGWVASQSLNQRGKHVSYMSDTGGPAVESVKSGSAFWADGGDRTTDSEFSLNRASVATTATTPEDEEDDDDSDGTETGREEQDEDVIDEVGAQDAFIAGMIYALSRKMVPGPPYTAFHSATPAADATDRDKSQWRLEECLKFATELAGRKAKRRGWDGLADEMSRAGWLEM